LVLDGLDVGGVWHERFVARPQGVGAFAHDAVGIDPREVRVENLIHDGTVAFLKRRAQRAVGLDG
jgi:hypothetical protein